MPGVAVAPTDGDAALDGSLQSADGANEGGFSTTVPRDEGRQCGGGKRGVKTCCYAVATIADAEMLEEEQGKDG